MELIIARHGQSEENINGVIQGRMSGHLSEIGRNQSEKLGQRLSKEKIEVAYCSPIARCRETCDIVQKYINPSVRVDINDLIMEIDYGRMTGVNWKEINFKSLFAENTKNTELGIETLAHVHNRMKTFFEEIKEKHHDKTVLVIGHSISLRMLLAHLLNKDKKDVLNDYKISNASISIFKVNNKIEPIIINETKFLE